MFPFRFVLVTVSEAVYVWKAAVNGMLCSYRGPDMGSRTSRKYFELSTREILHKTTSRIPSRKDRIAADAREYSIVGQRDRKRKRTTGRPRRDMKRRTQRYASIRVSRPDWT